MRMKTKSKVEASTKKKKIKKSGQVLSKNVRKEKLKKSSNNRTRFLKYFSNNKYLPVDFQLGHKKGCPEPKSINLGEIILKIQNMMNERSARQE